VETKYKEYAEQFKQKYPGVTDVEFEALKDYEMNLKVRLASREIPDVVILPNALLTNDAIPNYFAPLDDLGLNGNILFKDTGTIDGKLYRITSGVNSKGLVYNKKVFAEAGIEVPFKTLDDFYAACEKLKAMGVIPFATNFNEKWPLDEWKNLAIVASGDVHFYNKMIGTDTPFSVDGPLGQSLTILRTLVEKGYTEPDLLSTNWEASKKDVASGKMGMYLLANWVVPQIIENGAQPEDVGMMPMPADNSGNLKAYLLQDVSYVVNKDSKNIDTAKAFVKFLLEDSDYFDYSGFIPTLKDRKPSLPQLDEFMSYQPQILEDAGVNPKFTEI
jgi:ABC-type glycerol-3-phosphate transport system substrate-binding protein